MKFSQFFLITTYISCLLSFQLKAIEVFPIIKEIRQNTPRENYVTIVSPTTSDQNARMDTSNPSLQPYEFVTLELFEIQNPGQPNEILNKELAKKNPTLVYSPSRLVVPHGQTQRVRIIPVEPIVAEKIYRLRIRPAYPEQLNNNNNSTILFGIGYDVLVRYLPNGKQVQAISVNCDKNQWALNATGNVRSEIDNLMIDGQAYDLNFLNIYPNYPLKLTVNKEISFVMNGTHHVYQQCQLVV